MEVRGCCFVGVVGPDIGHCVVFLHCTCEQTFWTVIAAENTAETEFHSDGSVPTSPSEAAWTKPGHGDSLMWLNSVSSPVSFCAGSISKEWEVINSYSSRWLYNQSRAIKLSTNLLSSSENTFVIVKCCRCVFYIKYSVHLVSGFVVGISLNPACGPLQQYISLQFFSTVQCKR